MGNFHGILLEYSLIVVAISCEDPLANSCISVSSGRSTICNGMRQTILNAVTYIYCLCVHLIQALFSSPKLIELGTKVSIAIHV